MRSLCSHGYTIIDFSKQAITNNSITARYKVFNVSLVILNIINLSTFEQLRVVGGLILITQIIKEQNDVCFQASVTVLECIGICALQYISSTA